MSEEDIKDYSLCEYCNGFVCNCDRDHADEFKKLTVELSAANKRIEDLRDVLDEILLHMNKTDLGYFFPDGEQGALDRAKELL